MRALGNLRRMNRWGAGAAVVAVLLAGGLSLGSCTQREAPSSAASDPPAPAREWFDVSRPLRIEVHETSPADAGAGSDAAQVEATHVDAARADTARMDAARVDAARVDTALADTARADTARAQAAGARVGRLAWLEYELGVVLNRAKMRVAPRGESVEATYTLRAVLPTDGSLGTLELVAPDGFVEKSEQVPLGVDSRLATLTALASRLGGFLGATHGPADWAMLIGTRDAAVYDEFLDAVLEVLGPGGKGYTRPPAHANVRSIERLESLVRRQPGFARARAALALGYLSLGGEDEAALTQLAAASAERALSDDDAVADAHAALGLVHLRRSEWIAAHERFERALALDANTSGALEGLACLLVDTGHYEAARPIATRAIALQPASVGAHECFEYAHIARAGAGGKGIDVESAAASAPAARTRAAAAILEGDLAFAEQLLRQSVAPAEFERWPAALLRAAADRRSVPDALQVITLAANETQIDASTEILCGVALRQAEFVFNRMARLQRHSDGVRSHVPLRVLWMPQSEFLRRNRRYAQIVARAGLAPYWAEHGGPDLCVEEPALYGCEQRAAGQALRD